MRGKTAIRLVQLLAALTLPGGCGVAAPDMVFMGSPRLVIPPMPDRCHAGALASLVGQDFTRLADQPLPDQLRILWPGQEVTSDLRPRRLNAEVSAKGVIGRLYCG